MRRQPNGGYRAWQCDFTRMPAQPVAQIGVFARTRRMGPGRANAVESAELVMLECNRKLGVCYAASERSKRGEMRLDFWTRPRREQPPVKKGPKREIPFECRVCLTEVDRADHRQTLKRTPCTALPRNLTMANCKSDANWRLVDSLATSAKPRHRSQHAGFGSS